MLEILGDREISIGREITKIHEEFIRGKISKIIEQIESRGEMVIIVEGSKKSEEDMEKESRNEMSLEEHYKFYENRDVIKRNYKKI